MEVLPIRLWVMVIRWTHSKLGLTDKLTEVVMEEANACGTRQPMVIAGDLNAHHVVIPAATTAIPSRLFVGLEKACALGKGESPFSQFVPLEVGKLHRWSHSDVDVDLLWRAWCADVQQGLISA